MQLIGTPKTRRADLQVVFRPDGRAANHPLTPPRLRPPSRYQTRARRSRKALPITDTELKLMAAAAMIGLSSKPKAG